MRLFHRLRRHPDNSGVIAHPSSNVREELPDHGAGQDVERIVSPGDDAHCCSCCSAKPEVES